MGRRHRAQTGDGGGERRLRRKTEKQDFVEPAKDLEFYDDPSSDNGAESEAEDSMDDMSEEELLPLNPHQFGGLKDSDEEGDDEEERERIEKMTTQWGSSKTGFYDADPVEDEEDSEAAAEDEEEAALELQRNQAEMLDEDDFEVDDEEDEEDEEEQVDEPEQEDVMQDLADIPLLGDEEVQVERIEKDTSSITTKEKLAMIKRKSPELLGLIDEMKTHLNYLQTKLDPAVVKLRNLKQHGLTPEGVTLLRLRHELTFSYCTNIAFYLHLKASGVPLRDHPILQRLLKLKESIGEHEDYNDELDHSIEKILEQEVVETDAEEVEMDDGLDEFFNEKTKKKISHAKSAVSDKEAAEAMEFYNSVAKSSAKFHDARDEFYAADPSITMDDKVGTDGKRGASYQIMKNRGLVAHKNKVNRNPRVKKRLQYRKAVIRRKGQVREVRTGETGYYGGEGTGIKSNITRSRKIRS